MKIKIKRFEDDTDKANRGVIFIDNSFFGFSLERPNLDNKPFLSRINAGEYIAKKVHTEKRGWFWLLQDVPGRTEIILFHPGSYMKDFAGCIGCGWELGFYKNERMIIGTRNNCIKFMEKTEDFRELTVIIS